MPRKTGGKINKIEPGNMIKAVITSIMSIGFDGMSETKYYLLHAFKEIPS